MKFIMKRILLVVFAVAFAISAYPKKYNYSFLDKNMGDALLEISREHPDLKLSFIYDELEHYTVSVDIDSDNALEAIRQLMHFKPLSVISDKGRIYVEAIQKGKFIYTGTAINEKGEGVPFATVMILSPKDSTVLTYGVSDSEGRFSIPCDHKKVIVKLSSIGYHPRYEKCDRFSLGRIVMKENPLKLNNITVKAAPGFITEDKTIFLPTSREKNASHGGVDLIQAMGIPTLNVNPITKAITFGSGGDVSAFIDYQPADMKDLENLRPQDVKRIEVYESPDDPRFLGARYAINYIMVKYEYGGYTKGNASQSFVNNYGSYSLNSKLSYKKMTYDLSGGFNYSSSKHSGIRQQSVYRFPEETIIRDKESVGSDYSLRDC